MPLRDRAGFPTYWTQFGQGPRTALMIHCSLAHSGSWGPLARHLSGLLTMTAFDIPGHGQSGVWVGRGEIQGVTTDIAADFLESPMDIIGHSFGATVALRLAVRHPERVRSLTLIEPVFFALAFQDNPALQRPHDKEMQAYHDAVSKGDNLSAARAFMEIWGAGIPWQATPEAQRHLLASQVPLIEAATQALYEDAGGLLNAGVLPALAMPTLLIEGSQSPSVISAIHDGLAARIPHTTRSVILGAGHMAPLTHARQVSAEILRFLAPSP